MRYEDALRAADWMIDYLRPGILGFEPGGSLGMISIAGSLRRKVNKEYSEIDIIAIPDPSPLPMPRTEFGKPVPKVYQTKIEKIIGDLGENQIIRLTSSGPRNKKFLVCRSEISFDLYLVRPPATWGVISMIRTGPRSFGHWIVTRRSGRAYEMGLGHVYGGALPDGYRVQAGAVWKGETKTPEKDLLKETPIGFDTEEAFFEFLDLDYLFPEERVARWGGK